MTRGRETHRDDGAKLALGETETSKDATYAFIRSTQKTREMGGDTGMTATMSGTL
jgi:hypothetical protein